MQKDRSSSGRIGRPGLALGRAWATCMGLLGLLGGLWLLPAAPTRARIDPYYVLRDPMASRLRPRVLVVFDTSRAMAWALRDVDADGRWDAADDCAWNDCEAADAPDESRMAVARRGFKEFMAKTQGRANWALMTFDQLSAPQDVPPRCEGARFDWVEDARTGPEDTYGNFGYAPIPQYAASGVTGKWRLCSGDAARPYPYLRWDELGVGSVVTADDQTGPLPPSPLIATTPGSIDSPLNATRRVQWFPRFMGARVQLDATTDPQRTTLAATIGDYGADPGSRLSEVWEQDFYYWPYVDGFPGYAVHEFRPGSQGAPIGGIASEDPTSEHATLYAPFYLTFHEANVARDRWGPRSLEESTAAVLGHVSPLIEGGIDVSSDRVPWASVIGDLPGAAGDMPDAGRRDNRPRSHDTVASYLHFAKTTPIDGVCTPLSVVLVAGERPSFMPPQEGGPLLHQRLAALRRELGVHVYVIGIDLPTDLPDTMVAPPSAPPAARAINAMACAGAGACNGECTQPCSDAPVADWDTCADAQDRTHDENGCAFRASSREELRQALERIVDGLAIEVESGPASDLVDVLDDETTDADGRLVQTRIRGYTVTPGWRGHVTRSYCELLDESGDLRPQCRPPSGDAFERAQETFGPCPQSRVWDAGECLQRTPWHTRRIYTHDAAGALVPLAEEGSEEASAAFREELEAQGIVAGAEAQARATALMRFIKGADWPEDWKLPGLAKSAPVVVRRIPPHQPQQFPSVAIRDAHCAGRLLDVTDDQFLPRSLELFASEAYDGSASSPEYQEAVIVGDDLGVVHAFQYDSGNELWGFIPRFMLAGAERQRRHGATNFGQSVDGRPHEFGVGGTANVALAFDPEDPDDPADGRWRHLLVMGLAAGQSERRDGTRGGEYFALDVSHMNPTSPRGPLEVLWTTEDAALRDDYEPLLGQTWARPALSYRVPANDASREPQALVVFGSGYPVDAETSTQGRHLILADAVTGEIERFARLPDVPAAHEDAAPIDPDYGALVDPAIVSHCVSGIWAEIQEVYVPDPAGRLFRWDLGAGEADSGGVWSGTAPGPFSAKPLTERPFRACQSLSSVCEVDAGNRADPFVYGAAVSANDRIDDFDASFEDPVVRQDEDILVAMISGTPYDPRHFEADPNRGALHSSLYLLVDRHHDSEAPHKGLSPRADGDQAKVVPGDASRPFGPDNRGQFGDDDDWLRVAVSDLTRVRRFTPYPGAPTFEETARFSPRTRPTRAPQIRVQGLLDRSALADDAALQPVQGIEEFLVSYAVYEPPRNACDGRFYEANTGRWHPDRGETYEITLAVLGTSHGGFDFAFGRGSSDTQGYDLEGRDFVRLVAVQQLGGDTCVGGCGGQVQSPPEVVCTTPPPGASTTPPPAFAVSMSSRAVEGFTPIE